MFLLARIYRTRVSICTSAFPGTPFLGLFVFKNLSHYNSDIHRSSKNATLKSKKPLPQEKKVQLCFKPLHYECVCLASDSTTRTNRNWSKLACSFKQLGHLFLVLKLLYCRNIIKIRSSLYIFLFKSFIV